MGERGTCWAKGLHTWERPRGQACEQEGRRSRLSSRALCFPTALLQTFGASGTHIWRPLDLPPRPTHPSRPSSQQFTALLVLPGLLRPRFPARSSGSEWETGRGLHRELCSPTSSLGAAPQAVSTANSRKWAEGDRISGAGGGGVGCGCARSGRAHFPPDVFSHKLREMRNKKRARLLRTSLRSPLGRSSDGDSEHPQVRLSTRDQLG